MIKEQDKNKQQQQQQKNNQQQSIFTDLQKDNKKHEFHMNKKQKNKLIKQQQVSFDSTSEWMIRKQLKVDISPMNSNQQTQKQNPQQGDIEQQFQQQNQVENDSKLIINDFIKPSKYSQFKIIQYIIQWIFFENQVNPMWITIPNLSQVKNLVVIVIGLDIDKEQIKEEEVNNLNPYFGPFLQTKYKNQIVYKDNYLPVQNNLWYSILQNTPKDKICYNFQTANKIQKLVELELSSEDGIYMNYLQYILSEEELKNNLYPVPTKSCFSHFKSTSESHLDTKELKLHDKILALDCEMVSTNQGLELARVTIINFNGTIIIDELVKPRNPIINYNTQYSGITPELLKNVKTRLEDAQELILKYVYQDTILIGHSLENDLIALQLIHSKVIDTSLLYLPSSLAKQSLKNLAFKHLQLKIQEETHDSAEDSKATLSLAKLAIEILSKFPEYQQISEFQSEIIKKLNDQNYSLLIIDENHKINNLFKLGVHYDEIKENNFELKLQKVKKWTSKKSKDGSFTPNILMTQFNRLGLKITLQEYRQKYDSYVQQIFTEASDNTVFIVNFEFCEEQNNYFLQKIQRPFGLIFIK